MTFPFDGHILHALSSSLSDDCPLLLASSRGQRKPRSFKFESFWTRMPGFSYVVLQAWNEPCTHSDPYRILFHKLQHTSRCLRLWSRSLLSHTKLQHHMALEVVLHLDLSMESHQLSPKERDLRARLNRRAIALVVLERSQKKQCARIIILVRVMPTRDPSTFGSMVGRRKTSYTGWGPILQPPPVALSQVSRGSKLPVAGTKFGPPVLVELPGRVEIRARH